MASLHLGQGCCLLGAAVFGTGVLSLGCRCIWDEDTVSSALLHLGRGCCFFQRRYIWDEYAVSLVPGAEFRLRVLSLWCCCLSPPFLFAFLVSGECVSVQTPGLRFEIYIHPVPSVCGVLWNRQTSPPPRLLTPFPESWEGQLFTSQKPPPHSLEKEKTLSTGDQP